MGDSVMTDATQFRPRNKSRDLKARRLRLCRWSGRSVAKRLCPEPQGEKWMRCTNKRLLQNICALFAVGAGIFCGVAAGAPIQQIVVDGSFADWTVVPSHSDPQDDQHDTDHSGQFDTPAYVNHPDVDLLEYKFAHDEQNLYAYFRSRGQIGRTQQQSAGTAGRYYVIVTIDVDNS